MKNRDYQFFRAFADISKAISSTLNLEKILNLIIRNAVDFLDLKSGAISLWNKHENRLEMIAHLNFSDDFINKGPVYADRSMPRALTTRNPVIIPDIDQDDQLQYPEACKREGIRSLLSIPIIFKEDVIGVLRLFNSEIRFFTEQELEFMTALAELGGIAIENARFMDQLKKDHAREMDDLWNWFSGIVETPNF